MMCEVLKFDDKFDADGMTLMDMKREIQRRGWTAGRIDTERFMKEGRQIVLRVSSKAVEEHR
jgi:hypothetical protein